MLGPVGDFLERSNMALSSDPLLLSQVDLARQDHAGNLGKSIVKRVWCISKNPFALIWLPMREHVKVVLVLVNGRHILCQKAG